MWYGCTHSVLQHPTLAGYIGGRDEAHLADVYLFCGAGCFLHQGSAIDECHFFHQVTCSDAAKHITVLVPWFVNQTVLDTRG